MASLDFTLVTAGFAEDCTELIQSFLESQSIQFGTFCKIWIAKKFSLVFLCKKTYAELLEFCEEALQIAKTFVLAPRSLVEQIAGLFLLYSLFYKIPIENIKIRVTLKEWKKFITLHAKLREQEYFDASYIFVKLIYDDAFLHCLFESEYGLEKYYKVKNDLIENPHSIIDNLVEEIQEGPLSNFNALAQEYQELKANIPEESIRIKLQFFNAELFSDIENQIEALQKRRQDVLDSKKLGRPINAASGSEKNINYRYNADKLRAKVGHAFDTDSSADEEMEIDDKTDINPSTSKRSFVLGDQEDSDEQLHNEDSEYKIND